MPFTASTVATTPPNRYLSTKRKSDIMVCNMGAGSARPVVSTKTRLKGGNSSALARVSRSAKVSTRSPRIVQQIHPLCITTISSSSKEVSTNKWSMPISPNSLIITAVSENFSSRSKWLRTVVLPLPRNPVMTVMGFFFSSADMRGKLAL